MEDPDAARPENREERLRSLVRPYVGTPGLDTERWPVATAGLDEADPLNGFYFPPQTPAAGPGGLLEPAGPRDPADEHTKEFSSVPPAAGGPRRRTRPRPAGPAAARRRSLAIIVAVSGAATAGIVGLALTSNHKGVPMAVGSGSAGSRSAAPGTSRAGGGHSAVSMPASHATNVPAASATPAVSSPAPSVNHTISPASNVMNPPPASATNGAPSLSPGSVISIEATTECCSSFSITHDGLDDRVVITQVTFGSSAAKRADATWIVRQGLADRACISFESADVPGEYLNHADFQLFLGPNNGSARFASDATFCPRSGNSGKGYSFQSYNRPSWFIRHFRFVDYIANGTGGFLPWNTSFLWHNDTSWRVVKPWS